LSFITFQYYAPGKGPAGDGDVPSGTVSLVARHDDDLRFAQAADPKPGMRVS
jgi:hypothetical protein